MSLRTNNGYLRGVQLKIKEEKWFQANFFMSFFSIFVKSCLYFAVFKTVFQNSTQVDADNITLYYIIINIVALSIAPAQSVAYSHMEDINSGGIIPYLLRPNSYIAAQYLNQFALVAIRLLFNVILIFAASCWMGQNMAPASMVLGIFSVLLGFTILYLLQAIIGCCAIWFHDITRFRDVIYSLLMLLGGRVIPSDLLFGHLKVLVYYTPLPYVYDVPVRALMGNGNFPMTGIQIGWIVLLWAAYVYLFQCHVRHNVEFGG